MPTSRLGQLPTLLRPRAVAALARAQWALVVAQVMVWTRPVGALTGTVPAPIPDERRPPNPRALQLARAVRRAAHYGLFRPRCLARSVALHRLLQADGIDGSYIRVGVQRDRAGFAAHAWVELDGRVLGEQREDIRGFRPLFDIRGS